jgi:hypothetical protein
VNCEVIAMSKEKLLLAEKQDEVKIDFWEGEFTVDIDEIELEFDGQTPRLTGRIELNFEAL